MDLSSKVNFIVAIIGATALNAVDCLKNEKL
jgi:hypothetical protein